MIEHLERAHERDRLRRWLGLGAKQAFATGNLGAAEALAQRGLSLDPRSDELGPLLALRGMALGWAGRAADAVELAGRAHELLPEGDTLWFEVTGGTLHSAASLGNYAHAIRMMDALLRVDRVVPTGPCGFAYLAAASGMMMLGRREDAAVLVSRLTRVERDQVENDPVFEGWRSQTEETWERHCGHRMGVALRAAERASAMFERAGHVLGAATACAGELMWRGLLSQRECAAEVADRAETLARSVEAHLLVGMIQVGRALAIGRFDPDATRRMLETYVSSTNMSHFVGCHIALAELALAEGRTDAVATHLSVLQAAPSSIAQAGAYALAARLALREQSWELALQHSERGIEHVTRRSGWPRTRLDLHCARLEALAHCPHDIDRIATARTEMAAVLRDMCERLREDEQASFATTPIWLSIDAALAALTA